MTLLFLAALDRRRGRHPPSRAHSPAVLLAPPYRPFRPQIRLPPATEELNFPTPLSLSPPLLRSFTAGDAADRSIDSLPRGPNLGFPAAGSRREATMLPCARSMLRRRGLALLRGCAEGECGRREALANARCAATLAGLGDRGIGRWADPPARAKAHRLNGGWPAGTQTRCFLGCGDGEEGSVLSKVYEERRVMGYSPEQMYAVVAAVDLYEDFVPWCQRSRVVRRYDNGSFDAELEIGFKFLVESYVSHVEMEKPKYIKTTASQSGLFDHLINVWEFKPGPIPGTCDLYFLVDFKFQSPLYRQVASMFFKEVVSRLVGSFSDRCFRIYGPAVPVLENTHGQGR